MALQVVQKPRRRRSEPLRLDLGWRVLAESKRSAPRWFAWSLFYRKASGVSTARRLGKHRCQGLRTALTFDRILDWAAVRPLTILDPRRFVPFRHIRADATVGGTNGAERRFRLAATVKTVFKTVAFVRSAILPGKDDTGTDLCRR